MLSASYTKLLSVFVALTAIFAVLGSTAPASGEINSSGEVTWGVYGLATGTQTESIENQVWAIEQIGDRIYVGGRFLEARRNASSDGISQPYLAAFDANTGAFISTFRPDLDGVVYSLKASPDGSKLFVGGEFRVVNDDIQARGLVALDPTTGDIDTSWRTRVTNDTGARGIVYSLDVKDEWLYVGGRFTALGAGLRPKHDTRGAGRLSLADGTADTSFTVNATGGSVWGIAVAPDASKVYLAGHQTAVDGNTAGGNYSVLSAQTGKLIPSLSTHVGNSTRQYGQDVVAVNNLVFWGGSEHVVNVYDATTGELVRTHTTDRGGDFQDLEVVGDRVYASCHCYTNHWADYDWWAEGRPSVADAPADVDVAPIKYVAAYSASTGAYLSSFQLDVSARQAGVWAMHGADDGCLWVGGDLTRVTLASGQNRALGGFAKFCDRVDGIAPTTPDNLSQVRQEKRRIVLKWSASTDNNGVVAYEIRRDGELVGEKTATRANNYWFTDFGLTEGTDYRYDVVAVDGAGNVSDTATVSASTFAEPIIDQPAEAPTPPTGLKSTLQTRERIVLNWGRVDSSTYVIERYDGVGYVEIEARAGRWFTDKNLEAGTQYRYRVRTVNVDGVESAPSGTLVVTTLP